MRVVLLLLAACSVTTEAPPSVPPTLEGQSPPPAGAVGRQCTYRESHDATNDYRAAGGGIEETGIVFAGGTAMICGAIDAGHFDTTDYAVDIDNYGVAMASDGDAIISLVGAAQSISEVGVWVYSDQTSMVVGGGYFVGNHAVTSAHLPAGHYEISVEAYDDNGIAVSIPYQLVIEYDAPVARCPTSRAPADYVEAHDGPNNDGNDMIDVDFDAWPMRTLTTASGEAPEPTAMSMVPDVDRHFAGRTDGMTQVGSYLDRDTYQFTTGPATNQLSVRLDWPGVTADLDFTVSAAGSPFALADAETAQLGGGEFATFAVQPSTTYWLWIGAFHDSTAPVGYDATICAETFDPAD